MDSAKKEAELKDVFDSGFKLYLQLESSVNSSSSNEYQNEAKAVKSLLENATQMVNKICLFSDNEEIDEVATADVKYLLLPALLGSVTMQIADAERSEIIELGEIYFKDFLQRCKRYGVTDVAIPENTDSSRSLSNDLQSLSQKRQNKIARYKHKMAMETKIRELETVVHKPNVEDEVKREYYLLLLQKWIEMSLEELDNIQTEKSILKQIPKMKENKDKNTTEILARKPLTPIIIAKNEMQKKVFGLGYPSIPTMTVDEFYQHKYANEENSPSLSMNSLQRIANDLDRNISELDKEAEKKEKEEETDDVEALRRAREWDDWKDDNRRGSGNRKNMG